MNQVNCLILDALDSRQSMQTRMLSVDMLRLSKNERAISPLLHILLSEKDALLKKNCEDAILSFGTKALPYIDKLLGAKRMFMLQARNGSKKLPYKKLLKANEAQLAMQNLMSRINNGPIQDNSVFSKPNIPVNKQQTENSIQKTTAAKTLQIIIQ